MRMRHLRTRFILAGSLLVLTTVGSSVWSALTFARLSAVASEALWENQETIDLTAELAGSLEREDDALLLALSGDAGKARRELAAEQARGDAWRARLLTNLHGGDAWEKATADRLAQETDAYRVAGAALAAAAGRPAALERYHQSVNPLLRQAVASCAAVREHHFQAMQQAGVRAGDEARRATWVVAAVALAAFVVASAVAVWLARSVVLPVRDLTASVDALRQGKFDQRVSWSAADELGQLASGFNRMAETLDEYRRSSLGELLAAKTTLEATLNALPDAVIVVAPDGALAALNPPARAVLQAVGVAEAKHLHELPMSLEHHRAVAAALAGRPSVPTRADFGQALQVLLHGNPRKFLLTSMPIPEFAPRRFGAVVVLHDMTEFARLDELRSELIGVASHELKTPLTSLRMNLLLLGEKADDFTDRQHELFAAAATGCEELGNTIEELLDVTRIEAGQLRLNVGPVDLDVVLDPALRALRSRCEDAQVQVRVENGRRPALVHGDGARLGTVFTNLLTNALKYSPPGGTIMIEVSSGQNAGHVGPSLLQVAVTDAGPGIPAEFREKVFEKFFRVEHERAGKLQGVRGSGIGLYLCREIVRSHGGTIWCEPGAGGRGTRVAFTLPAAEA